MAGKACPECKYVVPDDAGFCPSCGAARTMDVVVYNDGFITNRPPPLAAIAVVQDTISIDAVAHVIPWVCSWRGKALLADWKHIGNHPVILFPNNDDISRNGFDRLATLMRKQWWFQTATANWERIKENIYTTYDGIPKKGCKPRDLPKDIIEEELHECSMELERGGIIDWDIPGFWPCDGFRDRGKEIALT